MKKITMAAVVIALVLSLTAQAEDAGNNQGTIKIHDELDADPDQRNEPHVDCDFYVEGFNMADSQATLRIYSWPPTGDKSVVLEDSLTLTPETGGDGHHFVAGPYTLPSGHYRAEVFGITHPGKEVQFAKAKMFWVECEEDDEPFECPPVGLRATALEDGSIQVIASDLNTDAQLLRDGLVVAELDADDAMYTDVDTHEGEVYTYTLAIDGQTCALVEVTAIPNFPSVIVASLAGGLGILGYVVATRRR